VLLATAATVVASQALISACFSLTQQLVNLGYMPRVQIVHTSARFEGQIYVPTINTFLMLSCITLVLSFRGSSALAAAYGLSVTGTMAVTTILFYFVARSRWNWSALHAGAWAGCFLAIELALLSANLVKITHGGWVPLAVGAALYVLMSTWRKGRLLVIESFRDAVLDMEPFLAEVVARDPPRVPGTAVFMTREQKGVPPVLLHHLKHNEVLHQQVILLSVVAERVPEVPPERRVEVTDLGLGVYRIFLRHGFMSAPNITQALSAIKLADQPINLARTSFYFGRETILPTGRGRMARWRKKLFAIMSRNATPATAFFGIPPNRVVELGTQVAL
jgi:KUP system potassium uptake protein